MSKDNQNRSEDKLVSQVCEALDDSVQRIDAETNQSIIAARQQALAQSFKRFTMPKIFAAATALSIFVAVLLVNTQFNPFVDAENTQSVELAATPDTIELYEELEFYTWLVDEDVTS